MKTETTIQLENSIYQATKKLGTFSCFEVTIGWNGHERVDFLTYNTKNEWRCYEIKATRSDFYSDAAKTFVGNFNYYVMPKELYDEVKDDIPAHVGVYVNSSVVKKPKKQSLGVDEQILKDSLIRSLYREFQKHRTSESKRELANLKRVINREKGSAKEAWRRYNELHKDVLMRFGRKWHDAPISHPEYGAGSNRY